MDIDPLPTANTTGSASPLDRRTVLQALGALIAAVATGLRFVWSRHAFLGRVTSGKTAYVRPPGARPEAEFIQRCIRCNQCADACENACIKFVDGSAAHGTPYLHPRGKPCILCMKCTHACPTDALQPTTDDGDVIRETIWMGTAVVDKNICNSYNNLICGVCVWACPFKGDALRADIGERPVVNEKSCVGCGCCENRCIVYPHAIRVVPSSKLKERGHVPA